MHVSSLIHMTFYSERSNYNTIKICLLSPNDNRNLRKYIIDLILKITNDFLNRATSEHSATLLKFIYIVWAAPKRFLVTTT